jgi:hypothetical protein
MQRRTMSLGKPGASHEVDITLLRLIFNHSTPFTTLQYIRITLDDMDDVIINLNL